MEYFIPEDKIREIQNASDILEIVSESVMLKKAGRNYQGLCPFHAEKTPSFSVNPSKQIYYCFGCGVGGNVFSFLMKREGVSFPEAVRDLAKRSGITLPSGELSAEQKQRMEERERIFAINRTAMEYYHQLLMGPGGEAGRRYFLKRNIPGEIMEAFHLGFAPDGWQGLADFIRDRHVPAEIAVKAGLLVPKKGGRQYYDAFRNRVMFPILNVRGQVIGFGGRVLDASLPKYLNSPETPVYNKRRSLYGIERAKQAAREEETVYVVEGYMDLITMHQYGVPNSVATLGTSLTGEHVELLKGLIGKNGRVILVYDSDAAGVRAAERSIDVFAKGFVDARILVLATGHDPDSFLREYGIEAFRTAATGAMGTISFLMEASVRRHGLSPEGRIRVISDLAGIIAVIDDPMAKSLYIKTLSERVQVDETAVMERIRGVGSQEVPPSRKGEGARATASGNMVQAARPASNQEKMEARIISMMLGFPPIVPEIGKRNLVESFQNETLKRIGRAVLENVGMPSSLLLGKMTDESLKTAAASLAISEDPWDEAGCKRLLAQFESIRSRENVLLRNLRAAEAAKAVKR